MQLCYYSYCVMRGGILTTVKHMKYFIALAEELSFSRAAQRLGIAQPTLTQMLQKVERELQTVLFEKSGKRMSLTPQGEIFIDACRRICDIWSQCEADIINLREGFQGHIVLGIGPSRCPYTLPPLLERFSREYPNVRLDVEELLTSENEEGVLNGRLDMALTVGDEDRKPTLRYLPVLRERILVAVRPELMQKYGQEGQYEPEQAKEAYPTVRSAEAGTFADIPFILLGKDQIITRVFDRFCGETDLSPHVSARCKTVATGLALANAGRGAALVTSSAIAYVRRMMPHLLFFSLSETLLDRNVFIMIRQEKQLSAPEKRLIVLLKETEFTV